MKNFQKIAFLIGALLSLALFSVLNAIGMAEDPRRFIVTQNTLIGRARGTIGGTIATTWKGLNVFKGKPLSVNNPQTTKQTDQRSKFSLAQQLASDFLILVRVGFNALAIHQSEFNACVSYNIQNAIGGAIGARTLTKADARISQGDLLGFADSAIASDVALNIDISFSNNADDEDAFETDLFYLALRSDLSHKVKSIKTDSTRADEGHTVVLPADWADQTTDVWGFFVSADGTRVSDSLYFGSIVVLAP